MGVNMGKKKSKKKEKRPAVIVEKTFVDEARDKIVIREYDVNQESDTPKKKQLVFPDPYEEGCIAIDWSKEAESALELAGIRYDILDPAPVKEDEETHNNEPYKKSCPNCGSAMNDMGGFWKCPSCGVFTRGG